MSQIEHRKTIHYPELDGIRGIAILMVVICHYLNNQIANPVWGGFSGYFKLATGYFWSGVTLFFVLSGFLIGSIIIKGHHAQGFWKGFYIRRSTRILPAYFVLLLSYYLIFWLNPDIIHYAVSDDIPDWTYFAFLQNFFMAFKGSFGGSYLSSTWSLAVEEQFYLLFPLLCIFVRLRFWPGLMIGCILGALVLRMFIAEPLADLTLFLSMDAIAIGVLIAFLIRNDAIREVLNRYIGVLFVNTVILFFAVAHVAWESDYQPIDKTLLIFFFAHIVLIALLRTGSSFLFLLRLSWLRYIGLVSYGLYLFHKPVLYLTHYYLGAQSARPPFIVDTRSLLITLLAFAFAVGVSCVSYHTYEIYFQRLSRKFAHR